MVVVDHAFVVGRQRHLTAEERGDGLRVVVGHIGLVERVEQLRLLSVEQRHLQQVGIRLRDEGVHGVADRLRQAAHELCAIASVVVLHAHRRLSLVVANVEGDAELRDVELEAFHLHLRASTHIVFEHAHLVGEHDLGTEVVVGGNLRERIVFVLQRLVEVAAGQLDEVQDTLLANLAAHRQRVHEHTHGVADAQVRASVADGADADAFLIGETRQGIERRSKGEVGCRDVVLAAEGLHLFEVERCHNLAGVALLKWVGEVAGHLRHALALSQLGVEEVAGSLMLAASLCLLLFGHEVGIRQVLGLHFTTIHQVAQLMQEEVHRTAVDHQVMDVDQQAYMVLCGDDLEAVQRSLLQVERLHELALIGLQLLCRHRVACDDDFLLRIADLHHVGALAAEVYGELRMQLYQCRERLRQTVGIGVLREGQQCGEVVEGAGRLLQAVHVDAHLRIRQRSAHGPVGLLLVWCLLRFGCSFLSIAAQHLAEYLILY